MFDNKEISLFTYHKEIVKFINTCSDKDNYVFEMFVHVFSTDTAIPGTFGWKSVDLNYLKNNLNDLKKMDYNILSS